MRWLLGAGLLAGLCAAPAARAGWPGLHGDRAGGAAMLGEKGAGQGFTYPTAAMPNHQGRATAAATGGLLWESVQ